MTKRADLVEQRGELEARGLVPEDLRVGGFVAALTPSELSEEQMSEAIELARLGAFESAIARVLGVDVNSFVTALRKGRTNPSSMYAEWAERFYGARKERLKQGLRVMNDAVEDGDWRPAAWQLERSFGFARQEEVQHEVAPETLSLMMVAQIPLAEAEAARELVEGEVVVESE